MTVPPLVSFAAARESPWMPGLGVGLASAEWTRIERTFGLDRGSYGTARYARRDRSAPRCVLGDVIPPAGFGSPGPIVLEELDFDASAPYRAMGLKFATTDEVVRTNAGPRLVAALVTVSSVPDLAMALGHLLGAIHILQPPGADYDVSHSDPDIPFSVFVGVSLEPGPLDRLRLAEELVHECMHLQLTLIEARRPLVRGTEELHPSPWQGRRRPTRGVLHGFYVFAALDAFFFRLVAGGGLDPTEAAHVRARRCEISGELPVVASALATSCELTDEGRSLVAELRRGRLSHGGRAAVGA